MKTSKATQSVLALLIAAIWLGGSPVGADDDTATASETRPEASASMMKKMMSDDMLESCMNMQKKHDHMMKKMEDMDGRLEELVDRMNRKRGAKKTGAIAGVVSELVAQHRIMWRRHVSMQSNMQLHVRDHMESMMKGMAASMAMCPMMSPPDESKDEVQSTKLEKDDYTAHH